MNESRFYLINTSPKYGELLLRSFKDEKGVTSFLLNSDNPNRYKLVYGEEIKFSKVTTMEFTPSNFKEEEQGNE